MERKYEIRVKRHDSTMCVYDLKGTEADALEEIRELKQAGYWAYFVPVNKKLDGTPIIDINGVVYDIRAISEALCQGWGHLRRPMTLKEERQLREIVETWDNLVAEFDRLTR